MFGQHSKPADMFTTIAHATMSGLLFKNTFIIAISTSNALCYEEVISFYASNTMFIIFMIYKYKKPNILLAALSNDILQTAS